MERAAPKREERRNLNKLMGRALTKVIIALAFLWTPAGCVRPVSTEIFIPSSKAEDGVYVFDIEMSDSLSTYDISFYTRVDGPQLDSLPLKVLWLSPSGESFSETVYMDPSENTELYRSGIRLYEYGDWRICVRPDTDSRGFRGLGIICRQNGTR